MVELSLPPRLTGSVKGTLDVRIDVLKALKSNDEHQRPTYVRLVWWGQTLNESPVVPILDGKSTVFNIVSKSVRFREYLRDAGRLFIEAINSRQQSLGYAVLERLERIVDFGGITADDVEVLDDQGSVVALLRCIFMYDDYLEEDVDEIISEVDDRPTITNKQSKIPRVAISSRPRMSENVSRPKVSFNDLQLKSRESEFNDDEHDYDEVASVAIDDDELALQQLILKSKEKIDSTKPKEPPEHIDNSELQKMPSTQRLPSWNLSTERLRFMSRVNTLEVKVRQVSLNPGVVPLVASFHLPKPSRQKPSYFIKYELPHEKGKEVTFCAKRSGFSKKKAEIDSILQFDSATSKHPVRFTTAMLDSWWVSNLDIQLLARHLGQRLPLPIGECRLGLKHLLMSSKYSGGAEMKLPLYSSGNFKRHLEKQNFHEEIIGDVHVTFTFISSETETTTSSVAKAASTVAKKPLLQEQRAVLESRKSSEEAAKVNDDSSSNNASSSDFVLSLLRVDEGRNFVHEHKSLYLTCRLFSQAECISSPVCWNSKSNPKFELQHVVPINASSVTFLEETCLNNHLVIEVWDFSEPSSKMVGVATVSLHQLYTAFKDPSVMARHLSSELPVIVINDWLSVRDVLHGGGIVGEIHVLMAAGLGTQIYRLTMLIDDCISSATTTTAFPASTHPTNRVKTPIMSSTEADVESMEENYVNLKKVPFRVRLLEARNLPLIHSSDGHRKPPVTYVSASDGSNQFKSQLASPSCNPKWDFEAKMDLPDHLLTDSKKRQFIAKVWHTTTNDDNHDSQNDYVIGFVAVDLGVLLLDGFTEVSGWYNIMDFVGRCRGQIRVEISPEIEANVLRQKFPYKSASSTAHEKINRALPPSQKSSAAIYVEEEEQLNSESSSSMRQKANHAAMEEKKTKKEFFWQPRPLAPLPENESTRSILAQKLSELDDMLSPLHRRPDLDDNHQPNDGDDLEDLERLRSCLDSQLRQMQSVLASNRMAPDGGNPTEPEADSDSDEKRG